MQQFNISHSVKVKVCIGIIVFFIARYNTVMSVTHNQRTRRTVLFSNCLFTS